MKLLAITIFTSTKGTVIYVVTVRHDYMYVYIIYYVVDCLPLKYWLHLQVSLPLSLPNWLMLISDQDSRNASTDNSQEHCCA